MDFKQFLEFHFQFSTPWSFINLHKFQVFLTQDSSVRTADPRLFVIESEFAITKVL